MSWQVTVYGMQGLPEQLLYLHLCMKFWYCHSWGVKYLRLLTWSPYEWVLHLHSSPCTRRFSQQTFHSATSSPGTHAHSWPRQEHVQEQQVPSMKKQKWMVQELSHLIVMIVNYLTPCPSLTYLSFQQSLTDILTSFKLLFACRRTDKGWSASSSRMKGLKPSKIQNIKENWTLRWNSSWVFLQVGVEVIKCTFIILMTI